MQILDPLAHGLRSLLLALPPMEIALTLGTIFFALSWVRPRRMVSLPSAGRRERTLATAGIAGSFAVLAVATASSWLSYLYACPDDTGFDGWWRRPAPLIAAALIITVVGFALRAEPLPAPGERAISPRRRWWTFVPRAQLWGAVGAISLLTLTSLWQTLIGVSAPDGADMYGSGPASGTDLPIFMTMQGEMGFVAGAGWPNHLAVLVAVGLISTALILTLGSDANRPLHVRSFAAEVCEERVATARMLLWFALGGILLTLGAVWAHTGFIGEIIVGVFEDNGDAGEPERYVVGTGYQDIAFLMHKGGYVVQALGAAVLMRLAVDTWRARRTLRQNRTASDSVAHDGQSLIAVEQQS